MIFCIKKLWLRQYPRHNAPQYRNLSFRIFFERGVRRKVKLIVCQSHYLHLDGVSLTRQHVISQSRHNKWVTLETQYHFATWFGHKCLDRRGNFCRALRMDAVMRSMCFAHLFFLLRGLRWRMIEVYLLPLLVVRLHSNRRSVGQKLSSNGRQIIFSDIWIARVIVRFYRGLTLQKVCDQTEQIISYTVKPLTLPSVQGGYNANWYSDINEVDNSGATKQIVAIINYDAYRML